MFRILILLVLGVGVGYMLRGRSFVGVTKWSIQITVCVLLFVFGVSIGSDRNLVDNFYNFGWQAAVIACLGVLGSIVAALDILCDLFYASGYIRCRLCLLRNVLCYIAHRICQIFNCFIHNTEIIDKLLFC